jgi:wyosine [tRNA(Phe)-imidazoG37] synthetase (radical SAM superfamily)
MGEPTLATNMDEVIFSIRNLTSLPIAILTNSSLLYQSPVQQTLNKLDIIVAKLDATNQHLFEQISRPAEGINFQQTFKGIKTMRQNFQGKFALQIMFMKENKHAADDFAQLAQEINPDEVQLNTPLRPCKVSPLSKSELEEIETKFSGLKTLSVYKSSRPKTTPLDMKELLRRRRTGP